MEGRPSWVSFGSEMLCAGPSSQAQNSVGLSSPSGSKKKENTGGGLLLRGQVPLVPPSFRQ